MATGIAAGLTVALVAAWSVIGYTPTQGIEMPKYNVIEQRRGYEIREYAAYIRAEVTRDGGYRQTLFGGFQDVAGYIFGDNTKREGGSAKVAMTAPVLHEAAAPSEKIAMTSPVLHEAGDTEGRQYTVAFIMPGEYTMETLPAPNNPNVKLRAVPAKRYAVLEFGGYASKGRAERKTRALLAALERDGIAPAAPPMTAQYNPPWTPFWMRRNEIQIEIAPAAG